MKRTFSRIFLAISLVSFGVLLGVILLAQFDWTKTGEAANEAAMVNKSKAQSDYQLSKDSPLAQFNNAFINISNQVTPSVVTIQTEQVIKHPQMQGQQFEDFFGNDFWKRFFPHGNMKRDILGSGVIVRKDGYILTNNHVVENADEITITLYDGREIKAEDVKTDPRTDLALIKVDEKDLPAIQLGNSNELQVGEWVLAIGSPFGEELQHTVTAGIVSAKGRTDIMSRNNYEDFIQTDAAINPGNSGGALVNLYGQLVGINTAIATRSGGNQGIGFAIPVNMATKVMNDLIEKGHVVRAWLGVYIQTVDNDIAKSMGMNKPYGALVNKVESGGPADKAGLEKGDVIIQLDGKEVQSSSELRNRIANSTVGSKHDLTVLREGKKKDLTVKLEELPKDVAQNGSEEQTQTQDFGLTLRNLTPDMAQQYNLKVNSGVLVTDVERGSVAAEKGIQPGDVITHIGVDNKIENLDDYHKVMDKHKPGDSVLFSIQRGDNTFFVGLTIPEEK